MSKAGRDPVPVTPGSVYHTGSSASDPVVSPVVGDDTVDAGILEQVLSAFARGAGGAAGRRAWGALPGMTGRLCGRFSAEARAAEMVCASGEPDQADLSGVTVLLAARARADPGFASALVPWLAAARMVLAAEGGTPNPGQRD